MKQHNVEEIVEYEAQEKKAKEKQRARKEGNITFSAIVQDLCLCLSLLVETYQLDNN
jgi:hypothetical protein